MLIRRLALILVLPWLCPSAAWSQPHAGTFELDFAVRSTPLTGASMSKLSQSIAQVAVSSLSGIHQTMTVSSDGAYRYQASTTHVSGLARLAFLGGIMRSGLGQWVGPMPVMTSIEERHGPRRWVLDAVPGSGLSVDTAMGHLMFLGAPVAASPIRVVWSDPTNTISPQTLLADDMWAQFVGQTVRVIRFHPKLPLSGDGLEELWVRQSDGVPIWVVWNLGNRIGERVELIPKSMPHQYQLIQK